MDLVDSIEAGKLTLSDLIDTLAKDENYAPSWWNQRYREFTTLLQQTSTFTEPETDDLVKRLWYERDNGIASIRQGVPSLAEYQQSLPLLRELTERVRQQPDEATYGHDADVIPLYRLHEAFCYTVTFRAPHCCCAPLKPQHTGECPCFMRPVSRTIIRQPFQRLRWQFPSEPFLIAPSMTSCTASLS